MLYERMNQKSDKREDVVVSRKLVVGDDYLMYLFIYKIEYWIIIHR